MFQSSSSSRDKNKTKTNESITSYPVFIIQKKMVLPYNQEFLHIVDEPAMDDIEKKKETLCVLLIEKEKSKETSIENFYPIGTLVKVISSYTPAHKEGQKKEQRIVVSAIECVTVRSLVHTNYLRACVDKIPIQIQDSKNLASLTDVLIEEFEKEYGTNCWKTIQQEPVDLEKMDIKNRSLFVSSVILSTFKVDKVDNLLRLQDIFSQKNLEKRMSLVAEVLAKNISEKSFYKKFKTTYNQILENNTKKYYNAVRKEALDQIKGDDPLSELKNYYEDIKNFMNDEARQKIEQELARFNSPQSHNSPDFYISQTFIRRALGLPWKETPLPRINIEKTEESLDKAHFGVAHAKQSILEHLAVSLRAKKEKGTVILFYGPPGVGKTALAQVIAKALDRPMVSLALGGMKDEAEIRGHRRTYTGALPGKILSQLEKCGSRAPVFIFDEIDKIGQDWRGDPASALLEVLDPKQNESFRDHYFDFAFPLDQCMFICTANDLKKIPAPLRDRMNAIEIPSYTSDEKFVIAKSHMFPKFMEDYSLEGQFSISDGAIRKIIEGYTSEAGVRDLLTKSHKVIARAITLLERTSSKNVPVSVTEENLHEFLTYHHVYHEEKMSLRSHIGTCTGLVWTIAGGKILFIEAAILPGKGEISSTGNLGDVMKESVTLAAKFIFSNMEKLGIDPEKLKTHNIHIHFPSAAVPKDGPSAGVAISMAITSRLLGVPLKNDVAITGEINLKGQVCPVGGIKEKLLAAYRSGMKKALIPLANKDDLKHVPEEVKNNMEIILIETFDEACTHFFLYPTVKTEEKAPSSQNDAKQEKLSANQMIEKTKKEKNIKNGKFKTVRKV